MEHTLFISDLHLSPERPEISAQFFSFVETLAPAAQALYILGDLFEYWAGDDDTEDELGLAVARHLAALSRRGTTVLLMQGNRDLLFTDVYAARCGARLLPDPNLIELYGTPTLLMHGDTLCTDDLEYQQFRAYARDPGNQSRFLALPVPQRKQQLRGLRAHSESSKQEKTSKIMDVAQSAVAAVLRAHGYPRLIHGHTHRPGMHHHLVDGNTCERWVLADWYRRGSCLRCDAGGCHPISL